MVFEGSLDGSWKEGACDGKSDGGEDSDGRDEGLTDGFIEGLGDGANDLVGESDGLPNGAIDGDGVGSLLITPVKKASADRAKINVANIDAPAITCSSRSPGLIEKSL